MNMDNTEGARPRHACQHKETCACQLCLRIQAAIDAGKPPKAVARAEARNRRAQALKIKTEPVTKREERIRAKALVEGALAGQVATGYRPSIAKAAQIAGITPAKARAMDVGEGFVQTALVSAGINDARLAQVAADALDATDTRVVYRGGEPETFDVPDWGARHKFWRDLLLAKKIIGNEREGAAAATLVIVSSAAAQSLTGHDPSCQCDACIESWQNHVGEFTTEYALRNAIDAELIDEIEALGADDECQ
jgi:hypothetical protein